MPLLSLTVGVTTMVDEPGNVPIDSWINDFIIVHTHEVSAGRILVFIDSLLAANEYDRR